MSTVISVENLSKSYRLGQINTGTFTYDLQAWWARVRGKPVPWQTIGEPDDRHRDGEIVWALKDVSFKVEQGEVLGIIGRNGAGKSTLLKILSRVTAPTMGQVKIKGRIASLLEVGTGFHPDLTGRENVYLNGAIMGMNKQEVARKFDEIVEFSGVEKFIDTPVKRYSSGMYVRLAFAVAAYLEPEILVVDEVLAVGDAEFQKKCLGKMDEVAKEGRTVLFVSHNMAAVQGLCFRCIYLSSGCIVKDDLPNLVISTYINSIHQENESIDIRNIQNRSGNGQVFFTKFYITNLNDETLSAITCGQDIFFVFEYEGILSQPLKNLSIGFSLHNQRSETIFGIYNDYSHSLIKVAPPAGKVKFLYRRFPYTAGKYLVNARMLMNGIETDWPRDGVGTIIVENGDFYGTGSKGYKDNGSVLFVDGEWYLNEQLIISDC